MNRLTYSLLLLYICFASVHLSVGKNILIYNPVGTYSTRISMWPYVEALANKGHQITFLSALEDNEAVKKHPNIKDYAPAKLKAAMGPWETHIKFYDLRKNSQMIQSWYGLSDMGVLGCQMLYTDPDFVKWAKSSKFDVVVVECIVNECGYGLAHYFNAKLVIYSTTVPWPSYIDAHGLPVESSSITDLIFGFPSGNQMSFWQRFANAIHPVVYTMKRKYSYFPTLEEITKTGLGIDDMPSFHDIEKNASLVLLTTHYSMDYPRSFPPHVIPIGGVGTAGKTLKPLPKEMEKFVESATKGFIFISFGTVAEFTNFDESVQQEFIKALGSFPDIKFVWKLSNGINTTLPSNVLMTKWAPQQTLLAHPKIKAFITHSGMGSTTEGIHFSVPMICFPILAEQDMNANSVAAKGAGIALEIVSLKQQELEHAISEILHNKKYRDGMTRLTEVFKDRQNPPLETAVWWTEFIMKYDNSNDFLLPPSIQQPWWMKRQADVWLAAVFGLIAIATISILAIRVVIRNFFASLFKDTSSTTKMKRS